MAQEPIDMRKASLGIELGSTRIKAMLVDERGTPLASGGYTWENRFINGYWTYAMEDVTHGLQVCYASLKKDVKEKYGIILTSVGAIGISGMMHGYLAFDVHDNLLVPFRTWRNTTTTEASTRLSQLFGCNIPLRWSISHLYQAILDKEPHVPHIARITTLSGYVHHRLTGRKVLGVGDASGMFPIDSEAGTYNARMVDAFTALTAGYGFPWKFENIFPTVLTAGESAGFLTEDGARFLDPEGDLTAGIPFCPPEGDAGTGMTATNSVRPATGNISAGTSIFAMVVLQRPLAGFHREIDVVTTPAGVPVAMVHCNNGTGDIDGWVNLFGQMLECAGASVPKHKLYDVFYGKALEGDEDYGGLAACNYMAGEPVANVESGRPLFVRVPGARFTVENFCRVHLFSAMAPLRMGMDILMKEEKVQLERLWAHGGFFKTEKVGQKIAASALGIDVSVTQTASEGGAWGMALLASYMLKKNLGEKIEEYLDRKIFSDADVKSEAPDSELTKAFDAFMEQYPKVLEVERSARRL
ncbi:xylulokinase [Parasphaerochaeta coccoides]|uniref:Carbohydrate kinase, FGGY n=1 Tax=Parasphaerochaeta coccoides (strain ATCC BAA-1237 / DSM 17374 / SPN1) TaxID=760011 RepID=F4GHN1_PARC1|nr:Carbohydrate kinase, FGGY [Parasphaerochaeta coccoides DSM 17374]